MSPQPQSSNVSEVVRTVRQFRQYKVDPIPDKIIEELLQVARWTGSSRNTQPWHFIVIDDREQLAKIGALRAPIAWVANAPLAIAIVLDGGTNLASEAYDEGRVTERILIAAHSLRLGGGVAWFGDPPLQAEAKRILDIPAERGARSVVVVGYPAEAQSPRPGTVTGGRKPLSEIVSYNRTGGTKGR